MKTKTNTTKAITDELINVALVGSGMALGVIGGKMIDKALSVDPSVPGFQPKKLVKPAVQITAGILGKLKLKNPKLQLLAVGIGGSGAVSIVNLAMNKNVLAGISSFLGKPANALGNYSAEPFRPSLPALQMGNGVAYSDNFSASSEVPFETVESADFEII